jgi:TRAP-type mannitol/chloroaromatic compound transport system permease small subunit
MPEFLKSYVRWVDRMNRLVGRFAMYLLFVMMGILLWSSISKVISDEPFNLLDTPAHWTLLMAQFAITAYYMLGGAYSMQLGSNVRMDLVYGSWSAKTKAWADSFTVLALLFYLGVLLYGGLGSTAYSLGYWGSDPLAYFAGLLTGTEEVGRLERAPGIWQAHLWPIKVVMCFGILLMILQVLAIFIRDVATIRGVDLDEDTSAGPTGSSGGAA